MTRPDQFESVFKAAAKTPFEHRPPAIGTVVTATDLDPEAAAAFGERVRAFLGAVAARDGDVAWRVLPGEAFGSVDGLLECLATETPDLIVTYRSLHSAAWRYTSTLGRYLDVLAQEVETPILVVPNPRAERAPEAFPHGPSDWSRRGTRHVMAMTDHLVGDHRLVNAAAHLVREDGTLTLAHVEDDGVFARYMEAIGKIPSIDTEAAREAIHERLLKDARDYARSAAEGLAAAGHAFTVEPLVTTGHRMATVRGLVASRDVDLLVLNTKDQDQYAMHGLAYPLVIELRHVPLLLL